MLGFVLSCHKMDDNYDQHTCDPPASTGSPCVKQKFTIHNLLNLSEMATITKLLFFHMFLRPTTNLLAYHDGGDLHKRLGSGKKCLGKQLGMRTSTSSPSSSDAMTSTRKWVTCAGTGFLVTCSTSALNFIGNRSSLCAKDKESQQ